MRHLSFEEHIKMSCVFVIMQKNDGYFSNQIQYEYYGDNRSIFIGGIKLDNFSAPQQTISFPDSVNFLYHAVFH